MSRELQSFLDRFEREVLPNLRASALVVSVCPSTPDGIDLKFAIELGASVMLDKPIVAVIQPGMKVPEKLARVVDRFVELDTADPAFSVRLTEAIHELGIGEGRANA